MASDLGGKRLELIIEMVPQVSRVGILWNAANPYSTLVYRETERAARANRIRLQSLEVKSPDDFDLVFPTATHEHIEALITVEDPLTFSHRKRIAEFAVENRLPAIAGLREFVDAGGLVAYGANQAALYRRGASYVDRILKGAKPADLPVQQPTEFELVINLRTAKTLELEVPAKLLALANEVIE
jgi:putative ABC transport system substrate-binding protein